MGVFLKRKKYFIDFYADGKRVRECVGRVSRRVAENALKARQGEVVQGRYQLPRKAVSPRFAEFAVEFLEYSKSHKSSRTTEADHTRMTHLVPFFGSHRLDEVTPFLVTKYVQTRRNVQTRLHRSTAPATINREVAVLKNLFNKAIEWGRADRNPAKGVRMLKEPDPPVRVLSDDEEQRLLEACCPHLRVAILIALNTGLRLQETLQLRWKDVDFAVGLISVERRKGGKSAKIEMNTRLTAALLDFRAGSRSDYLFVSDRTGKPILSPKTAFRNAVRRSGIPHCRFHDLRHTFATRLVRSGVDIVTVQKLMGHASISMTLRYSHPGAAERRRAVELLSDGHHMDTTGENVVAFGASKVLSGK